jgi:hypothetical protein
MRGDCTLARGLLLACLTQVLAHSAAAQTQPAWVLSADAKDSLARLWSTSSAAQREYVGCLGGSFHADTVHVTTVRLLDAAPGDSLNAPAEFSLATCAPPGWMGTVHTHVRSTDDPSPAPRFSGDDRVVMSVWAERWRTAGAFCVLYSDRGAHCEVYPPGAREFRGERRPPP